MFHTIKLLEDRNVANEINCMAWSDRMDLVAFSNVKGEVNLHRLTWARAWSLAAPKEGLTVNGLAWRPDGKILAIAYSSGEVVLINIETKAIHNKLCIPGNISFISWTQDKHEVKHKDVLNHGDDEDLKYPDTSKVYIKDPPPVAHIEGTINFDEMKGVPSFMQEQTDLNILAVGTADGHVYLQVFGCWTCVILDVKSPLNSDECAIVQHLHFVEDLSKLFVTVKVAESGSTKTVLYDTSVFKTHPKELFYIGMKYIKLYELFAYTKKILASIKETWESVLLEIDNKLSNYASKVPEGGVTADFLDLLLFGFSSGHMEAFLLRDLTKRGLEKFGQTVEVSYSNIQTYLFRHVVKFSQNATYHLNELKGMSLFRNRYGILGLNEDLIQQSIRLNGAFMIKASEMQQVINYSVINYKAFFRWLYASIMHVMEEPVPADIQQMTHQDKGCITEFLKNFDNYGSSATNSEDRNKCIMERLGQYLEDAPLTIQPDMSGNYWTQFIGENGCIRRNTNILAHFIDRSLIQVYNELKQSVMQVFSAPVKVIKEQLHVIHTFNLFNSISELKIAAINVTKDILLFSLVQSPNLMCLWQIHVEDRICQARGGKFMFHNSSETNCLYEIIDSKFYSTNIASILLQDTITSQAFILQFPLASALDKLVDIDVNSEKNILDGLSITDGSDFVPKLCKNVEMAVSSFAVSGTRRVSIVLSENRRKIKLYEMEGEEEDDEDADMTNNTLRESDVSMQDVLETE